MDAKTDESIFARLTGFHELRLSVAPDYRLSCISVDVNGLGNDCNAVLAPSHALELAHRLIGACVRLRRREPDGAGPISGRY
jgi:hypothetical protein